LLRSDLLYFLVKFCVLWGEQTHGLFPTVVLSVARGKQATNRLRYQGLQQVTEGRAFFFANSKVPSFTGLHQGRSFRSCSGPIKRKKGSNEGLFLFIPAKSGEESFFIPARSGEGYLGKETQIPKWRTS
jgi:hypothetical protein